MNDITTAKANKESIWAATVDMLPLHPLQDPCGKVINAPAIKDLGRSDCQ